MEDAWSTELQGGPGWPRRPCPALGAPTGVGGRRREIHSSGMPGQEGTGQEGTAGREPQAILEERTEMIRHDRPVG